MIIENKVCRGGSSPISCLDDDPLLNWGSDISDVLLTDHAVAFERGRIEIDSQYTNRSIFDISVPSLVWVQPGSIVQVCTETEVKNGMLKEIQLLVSRSSSSISLSTSMQVETNE